MREYDKDIKKEAIKLSYEIGPKAAADKLGIPGTTLYTWRSRTKQYGEIAFNSIVTSVDGNVWVRKLTRQCGNPSSLILGQLLE